MKKVLVTWKDITSDDGWHDADSIDKFVSDEENIALQIGFLYEEDENQIVLLDSYFLNKDLFGTIHKIPRGCVISVTEL